MTYHVELLVYAPKHMTSPAVILDWSARPDNSDLDRLETIRLDQFTERQIIDPDEPGVFLWKGTLSPGGGFEFDDEMAWDGVMRPLNARQWKSFQSGLLSVQAT